MNKLNENISVGTVKADFYRRLKLIREDLKKAFELLSEFETGLTLKFEESLSYFKLHEVDSISFIDERNRILTEAKQELKVIFGRISSNRKYLTDTWLTNMMNHKSKVTNVFLKNADESFNAISVYYSQINSVLERMRDSTVMELKRDFHTEFFGTVNESGVSVRDNLNENIDGFYKIQKTVNYWSGLYAGKEAIPDIVYIPKIVFVIIPVSEITDASFTEQVFNQSWTSPESESNRKFVEQVRKDWRL